MESTKTCPLCGSHNLEPGQLHNKAGGFAVDVVFRPKHSKLLTLHPDVKLEAYICLDCGHLELRGDVAKAGELTKK